MFSGIGGVDRFWAAAFGAWAHFARVLAAVLAIASALLLTACGGGGDNGGSASINIGVSVGGQPQRDVIVGQGGSTNLTLFAGESVVLDAGEPVTWTLFVGGSAVGTGAQVFYAGLNLTASKLDAFTVALNTFADFPLAAPVAVTLVATSPFDSALVATVNILITN
jgi:hypothetical protein